MSRSRNAAGWAAASLPASSVRLAMSRTCPCSTWQSLAPSVRRALRQRIERIGEAFEDRRIARAAPAASRAMTSSCTMTPLSARRPSMRAGARPVSAAISFAIRTADESAAVSMRRPRALSCGSTVSVAWMLPRLKRSPASMRAAGSTLSKPGGMRKRRSSPRPLTLFTSQRQRTVAVGAGRFGKAGHADEAHAATPDSAAENTP